MARTQILVYRWRPRRRVSVLFQMTWTEFTNLKNLDSLLINCWSSSLSCMSVLNNCVCPFAKNVSLLIRLTSFYSTYDITLIKWLFYLMINLTSIHSFNIYSRMVSKSWKKMLLILVEYQKFSAYQTGKGTALSRTLHINFQLFLGFNRLVENALTQKTCHQTVEERADPIPPTTPPPPLPTETFQKEF